MAMEKEALTNTIESDLARRNRNWDKIDDHLAESTSKHIHSSGSNVNGSYIKFDDGTMMFWRTVTINSTISTALSNGGYRSSGFNFVNADTFIDEPSFSAGLIGTGAFEASVYANGYTQYTVFVKSVNAIPTAQDYRVHIMAIGRWK